MRAGATKQFTATLNGITGTVAWTVNSITGGSPTVGTITPDGLYTAPYSNPGAAITVRATAGTPASFAESTVTWLNPQPSISSLSPSAVNIGTFSVTVNGKGFVAGSKIALNGTPVAATPVSSTALVFQATISTAGTATVQVVNPDPGAAASSNRTLTIMPPVAIQVSPAATNVRLGTTRKFSAPLTNAVNRSVIWSVAATTAGADPGTIAADGTYTAPLTMPVGGQVTVKALSAADSNAAATAVVTLLNPVPAILTVAPNPLTYGAQTISITGTGFVSGSQVKLGSALLTTQYISPTQLSASTTIAPVTGGLLTFRVSNPDPGAASSKIAIVSEHAANPKMSYLAAARFLEQASWGPSAADIAHLQDIGFEAWLDEQMAAASSLYKISTSDSDSLVNQQSEFFVHAMRGPDPLRQRVAFALGQIFVVSGLKTGQPRQMVPYQNMLLQDAFGSYQNILRDVTLSPTMGVYLDMVNNDKADPQNGTAPNENYGREVMQLLSVGTALLNQDGSTQKDGFGQPLPTYDQSTITGMARALTGWTFPGPAITQGHNKEKFNGPMVPVEANHDQGSKTIVGGTFLPPGQTAEQDLDAVLQALANHPNTAPFISLRLIEHLVTSNPSPAYMARMSAVFTSTHGDLGKLVRAILLDPEARAGDDPNFVQANGGHLREPALFVLSMMKALSATVVNQNPIEELVSDMGQSLFYAPSIFNYYSPLYRVSSGLQAPEFQLLSSSTALVRSNIVQSLISRNLDGDVHYDLSPLTALASSPADLVNAVDNAFLYGRMPAALKADIATAIAAAGSSGDKVRNAIYLMATSSLYQVQH